mmetsp:Transcript_15032/g.21354  ORF Transcript_15032/g.21354 Transcript_15032/m.21354 type:complete len:122 (-) Transcript_15032:666-1031(-)
MFRRRLQLLTGNGMNILGLPSAQTILSSDPWQHLLLARVREKSLIAFLSKTIHAVITPPKQSNEAGSKAKFKYQSTCHVHVSLCCENTTNSFHLHTDANASFQCTSLPTSRFATRDATGTE